MNLKRNNVMNKKERGSNFGENVKCPLTFVCIQKIRNKICYVRYLR